VDRHDTGWKRGEGARKGDRMIDVRTAIRQTGQINRLDFRRANWSCCPTLPSVRAFWYCAAARAGQACTPPGPGSPAGRCGTAQALSRPQTKRPAGDAARAGRPEWPRRSLTPSATCSSSVPAGRHTEAGQPRCADSSRNSIATRRSVSTSVGAARVAPRPADSSARPSYRWRYPIQGATMPR
jgi:hypothetical protein